MNLTEEEIVAFIVFAEHCYQFKTTYNLQGNLVLVHADKTVIIVRPDSISYKRPNRPLKEWNSNLKDALHCLRMSREQMQSPAE